MFTFQLCRQFKIEEGEAYLLEKNGDYKLAFNIRYRKFKEIAKEASSEVSLRAIEDNLETMIQFSQRCSEAIAEANEREQLWFPLLEEVVDLQAANSTSQYAPRFEEFTGNVLKGMMRHVPLMSLLQWILKEDPTKSEQKAKISNVKDLLMKMLEAYNYEATLFETMNSLLNHDLNEQLTNLTRGARKAYTSRTKTCELCEEQLRDAVEVVLFKCGHSFHAFCLDEDNLDAGCPKCSNRVGSPLRRPHQRRVSISCSSDQTRTSSGSVSSGTTSGTTSIVTNQQHDALEHIKSFYRAAPGVEVLRQLASKSLLSLSRDSTRLTTDKELNLAPRHKFNSGVTNGTNEK